MRPDNHKIDNEYIDFLIDRYKEVYREVCLKNKRIIKNEKNESTILNTTKLEKEELFKWDNYQLEDIFKDLDI